MPSSFYLQLFHACLTIEKRELISSAPIFSVPLCAPSGIFAK